MRGKYVATVAVVALSVAACGGDSPSEVTGDRDDVRHTKAVKEKSHREKTSTRKCARRVDGKCKSYKTVTGWKKVVDRAGKPAVYCVELDNVNGDKDRDDEWYTVRHADYVKALFKAEDAGLKFTPIHSGC